MTGGIKGFGAANPVSMKAKLIGAGIGLLLLVAGLIFIYQQGKNHGISKGNEVILDYQNKVKDLNAELLKKEILVRERVITNYHTREIVRTKIEYVNRDIIRNVVPEQFKLSKGWIYAHDQSALGKTIDPVLAADSNPSNTSDRAALSAVAENYNLANRTADQLEALQTYIRDVGIPITNDPQNTRPSN